MTLLEIVQDVLASLGSDEVNNINDTTESMDVARIVKRVYNDIVDLANLPIQHTYFQLDATTDAAKPTIMTKPDDVNDIEWVKYNRETLTSTDQNFMDVFYLDQRDFIEYLHAFSESETAVLSFDHVIDGNTFSFLYRNDAHPTYYTSFDDNTLIFDSYLATVDDTLQQSKTWCYGEKEYSFDLSNTFEPVLTDKQQTLLLNESIATAWVELKQTPHGRAERTARRQWVNQQSSKRGITAKSNPLDRAPNFGRTGPHHNAIPRRLRSGA
jgi:hypothetical protein